MGATKRELPSAGLAVHKRELKRVAGASNVKREKLSSTGSGRMLTDLGSGVRLGGEARERKGLMLYSRYLKFHDPLQKRRGRERRSR